MEKLNHPNVIHIYDVVDDEQGIALVMKYVDGSSFREYLDDNTLSLRHKLDY